MKDKAEIKKAKNYAVAKSNELVLKTRYDFSLNEQKTLAFICSMIKPVKAIDVAQKSPYVLEYEFEIADFTKMLGLEMSGRFYTEVKDLLKGMISKVMWMTLEDGTETTVNWIQKAWTNKRSGKARIRVDEDLVPYLFDLKERYLSYGLRNILVMKSQYSIRLYEMLKAQYDMKIAQTDKRTETEKKINPRTIVWNIGLDELKKKLMVENIKSYSDYGKFRQNVLEVAEREINELTDMNISAIAITKGRKTVGVEFKMTAKNRAEKKALNIANDEEFDDAMEGQTDLFDL